MRKFIYLFLLLFTLKSFGQYPIPQTLGRDSTIVTSPGGFKGKFINFAFTDTTQANTHPIKYYPGSQIFTTSDTSIWLRTPLANRWVKPASGSGGITTINNFGDTTIICYSDGSCDTLTTNLNNKIETINRYTDSSIIICYSNGSCDTLITGSNVFGIDTLYKTNGIDSIYWEKRGITYAIEDSTGPCLPNKLLSGGAVTYSGTGFKYYVSGGQSIINCKTYDNPFDSVTFAAADPTFCRIDRLVQSDTGLVILQGTPAALPVAVQLTSSQFLLYELKICPGETTPTGVTTLLIYNENVQQPDEFNTAVLGVTIDPNQTPVASSGIRSIYFNNAFSGGLVYLSKDISIKGASTLYFKIKLTTLGTQYGVFPNGVNLWFSNNYTLSTWATSLSQVVSVTNGKYGLNTTNTDWQLITIPMADFKCPQDSIDILYIMPTATISGATFYIDQINMQSGVNQTSNPPSRFVTDVYKRNDSLFEVKNNIDTSFVGLIEYPLTFNNGLTRTANNAQLGGTLTEATTTVTLDANTLRFRQGSQNFLQLSSEVGAETAILQAYNTTGSDQRAKVTASTGATSAGLVMETKYNGSAAVANIALLVDATTSEIHLTSDLNYFTGRMTESKGADVAAANDLTLGAGGNLFTITGATTINAIITANWQAGSEIAFIFTGAPLVKNNTAGGAGTATMLLAGRVDYQAAAGDYIGLRYDGTNWYETNRKLAGSGGVYNFTNGLTESPAGTVKLGGTLTGNTTIAGGAFGLISTGTSATVSNLDISNNSIGAGSIVNISSTSTAAASNTQKGINVSLSGANATSSQSTYGAYLSNTHSGTGSINYGLYAESTTGGTNYGIYGTGSAIGVYGVTTSGKGVQGQATTGVATYGIAAGSGTGVTAVSTNGLALNAEIQPSSTNTVGLVAYFLRGSTGTPANGIGAEVRLSVATTTDANGTNTGLIAKWADATHATRTSQFIITGVNSAVTADLFTLSGSGATQLNKYGVGTFTGTATYSLLVDASGNIIEGTAGGGAGGVPTWQQTLTAGSTLTGDNTAVNDAHTFTITGNTIAGDPILSITSTSTAAASNLQKGLNISLSGANSTTTQSTYGVYSSNTHSGTLSTNYAGYFIADGGVTNRAVFGTTGTDGGIGVYGNTTSTNGYGVFGNGFTSGSTGVGGGTTTGYGVYAQATGANGRGLYAENTSPTGTGYGVYASATGAKTTGVAGYFVATGASANYAIIVPASSGDVGIGTSTPVMKLQVVGRLGQSQGADVASAAGAIAVGLDGNVFELTGTNAVTLISNLNFVNGSVIYLLFTSTATLTDGTANSGTDIGMELLGNANFVGSAEDVVTLVLSEIGGTQRWRMVSSSVN